MALPERHVVLAWVGESVVDRAGAEIGVCTGVFGAGTDLPEWVGVEFASAGADSRRFGPKPQQADSRAEQPEAEEEAEAAGQDVLCRLRAGLSPWVHWSLG